MWIAEMKSLLLGNKFRGTFADVQHVLLVGVSSRELPRLQTNLNEELRTKQIYLLDPSHTTPITTLPSHIHLIHGKVGDDNFDGIEPGMFDIIIIDFSVIKFIDLQSLAIFANVYLNSQRGHLFVRDLVLPPDILELPSAYSDRTTKRITLEYPNNYTTNIQLQPSWTTEHYMYYLNLSNAYYFTSSAFSSSIKHDVIWYDVIPNGSKIIINRFLGNSKEYEMFQNIFNSHNLKCDRITSYPLSHKHGVTKGMLDCTFG